MCSPRAARCFVPDVKADGGEVALSAIKFIRYGLGARGIDRIERDTNGAGTLVGYPVYDSHGNNVATLTKGSSNSCSLSDQRGYDAWGAVRTGNTTGEPMARHCANLGHLQDDESGLVYMRARYYEPGTGRFVSQDPSRNNLNWFIYGSNNPITRVDRSGKYDADECAKELYDFLSHFTKDEVIKEILFPIAWVALRGPRELAGDFLMRAGIMLFNSACVDFQIACQEARVPNSFLGAAAGVQALIGVGKVVAAFALIQMGLFLYIGPQFGGFDTE